MVAVYQGIIDGRPTNACVGEMTRYTNQPEGCAIKTRDPAMAAMRDICDACGDHRLMPWRRRGFQICAGCGHVVDALAQKRKICQPSYFNEVFAAQNDPATRLYERLNARRRLRDLRRYLSAGRILEVGVGRGTMLRLLKRAGYDSEGLDISLSVATAVSTRHGVVVHHGELGGHASVCKYDAVVMCHVLEHFEAPLAAARTVRSLLNQGGILYVAVPNTASWNAWLPGWSS